LKEAKYHILKGLATRLIRVELPFLFVLYNVLGIFFISLELIFLIDKFLFIRFEYFELQEYQLANYFYKNKFETYFII